MYTLAPFAALPKPSRYDRLQHLPELTLTWERSDRPFEHPLPTSRGAISSLPNYIIRSDRLESRGLGECSPIPSLSPEWRNPADYEALLNQLCSKIESRRCLDVEDACEAPSIRFGVESAILDMLAHDWDTVLEDNDDPSAPQLRNHLLLWMGTPEEVLAQAVARKPRAGDCLKFKVGSLPWEEELALVEELHRLYPDCLLRLDANGAFAPEEALSKIEQLAERGAQQLEQPIAPGQWETMRDLMANSPLLLALDEELTPCYRAEDKARLMDVLIPNALVIKPTLHGGYVGTEQWCQLAEEAGCKIWINSALESPLGSLRLHEMAADLLPDALHGLGLGRFDFPQHYLNR